MKKFIIVLLIVIIGLIGLNVYTFLDMQKNEDAYKNAASEYTKYLEEEKNKQEEVYELESKLEDTKNKNNDNEQYRIWHNLVERIKALINKD